jgi:hypothetical protein
MNGVRVRLTHEKKERAMRSGKWNLGLIGMAALAAFVSGCETTPAGPYAAQQDPASGQYPTVTVEPALQQFLTVDYNAIVSTAPTASSPMTVQVPLRSTADTPYLIQYQFSWFDDAGFATGDSGWMMLAMEPGMQRLVRANATDGESTRWRLEVRSSR